MSKKEDLYCYLRVSSKVQEEEGNSIDNQRFLGQRVSKKLGLNYVEMNEGHFGGMDRYKHWKETAYQYAFVLKTYNLLE